MVPANCPDCETEVSNEDNYCPSCGYLLEEEPKHEIEEVKETSDPDKNHSIHPWRRFFARTCDYLLLGFIAGGYFAYSRTEIPASLDSSWGTSIFLAVSFVPLEIVYLYFFSTTPMKWLLGLKLVSKEGELSLSQITVRSIYQLFSGVLLGIPILTRIANYLRYRDLQKKGITGYDKANNCDVIYVGYSKKQKWFLSIIVGLFVLILILQ